MRDLSFFPYKVDHGKAVKLYKTATLYLRDWRVGIVHPDVLSRFGQVFLALVFFL